MSSCLVIGGTGFIGRHLVGQLLGRGYQVRVVSRRAGLRQADSRLFCFAGDVGNPQELRAAVRGAAVVYNLVTGGGEEWADFERDVVRGSAEIARICWEEGVSRLVHTSSISALYLGGRDTINFRTPCDDQPGKRSLYARAKIAVERVLLEFHQQSGFPVVIVRPGVVMGPGGTLTHGGVGLWAADTCCLGWGQGENPLPLVLAQDVASALRAAAGAPGIDGLTLNLVGDVRLTARQFVAALGERAKRNFRFYPQRFAKMQTLEAGRWILKRVVRKPENAFPSLRDLKSRALRSPFDCSQEKLLLGWRPVADVETFLNEAIDSLLPPMPAGDLRLAAESS